MKIEFKDNGQWRLFGYAGSLVVLMAAVARLKRQGFEFRVTDEKGEPIRVR